MSISTNAKKASIVFAACGLLLLGGCASKQSFWEKPGATVQDFNMDRAECNARALSVPGVTLFGLALIQNQCLQGKGWYIVEREVK